MMAHQALNEAVRAALRTLTPPPCTDTTTAPWWLASSAAERARAAELCAACPVLAPCRAAGATERFGVWGGVDRAPGSGARTREA